MAKKKRSGIAWIAAAVAVVVLAAIALGWVLGSRGDEAPPPVATHGTSGGPVVSSSSVGEETDGICGLPVGDRKVPDVGPDATWELKRGMTIPTSKEYGPGIVKGGDRACFAHNPMGAVFFALNLPAVDPDKQDLHIKGRKSSSAPSESTAPSSGSTVFTVRGFKVDAPSPDRAIVTTAFEVSGQPGYQAITAAYEWSDGDWKGVLDDPSNTTDEAEPLTSLDGFVPWGPK